MIMVMVLMLVLVALVVHSPKAHFSAPQDDTPLLDNIPCIVYPLVQVHCLGSHPRDLPLLLCDELGPELPPVLSSSSFAISSPYGPPSPPASEPLRIRQTFAFPGCGDPKLAKGRAQG